MFYKSRFKITTITGNNIEFILKGNGSYKEEHIKPILLHYVESEEEKAEKARLKAEKERLEKEEEERAAEKAKEEAKKSSKGFKQTKAKK